MRVRVETPKPEQVPGVEGKATQKFKPTVPAHWPPTLSRARQRASQLFLWRGGGSDGNSLNNGRGEIYIVHLFFYFPSGEVERLVP